MTYVTRVAKVTTVGGAGAATGTGTVGLPPGKLVGLAVNFTGVPATTDTTVVMQGTPDKTLLTITNSATNIPLFVPAELVRDGAGATIAATYGQPTVNGTVEVTVAQSDAATNGVVVTLIVEI